MTDELMREDQDSEYRFEVRFRDLHAMRVWHIMQPPIDHEDVGYMRAIFERLSPEMRKYIIDMATLILRAIESPGVEEMNARCICPLCGQGHDPKLIGDGGEGKDD